jgi:hypothetical protein
MARQESKKKQAIQGEKKRWMLQKKIFGHLEYHRDRAVQHESLLNRRKKVLMNYDEEDKDGGHYADENNFVYEDEDGLN